MLPITDNILKFKVSKLQKLIAVIRTLISSVLQGPYYAPTDLLSKLFTPHISPQI